ncbi:hypothetical protein ABIE78_001137 [Sinorhizobium fredii]
MSGPSCRCRDLLPVFSGEKEQTAITQVPSPACGLGAIRQPSRSIEHAHYIPCGPRFIAAIPVRQTSIRPSGFMMAMNCSIFEGLPVISKTK